MRLNERGIEIENFSKSHLQQISSIISRYSYREDILYEQIDLFCNNFYEHLQF